MKGSIMQEHIAAITENLPSRTYAAGSIILYQGEVPRSVQLLRQGVVRVFAISDQGDEQIVTYHTAGEFFPTSWLFEQAPGSLFFYEAVTECQIAVMAREVFFEALYSSPKATQGLVHYFATNYAALLIRIAALEQPKARQKLLYTLYYLCKRYGQPTGLRRVRISLDLTHQHLAGLVGLTRETTAIEMNRLRKEKILTYANQTYDVNMARLLDVIGEDSLRGVTIES